MMTDPIADMLTRIRNAQMARNSSVVVPFSNIKLAIANILLTEGYLNRVEKNTGSHPELILTLKYTDKLPAITALKRESKPGHRAYCKADEMPRILNGFGLAILSTPKGVMTNKEAHKLGVGGEIICSVY